MPRLTGLIAATHTPFHADGSLNLSHVPRLVEHLIRDGVSGLYVCGSTGEGVSMTSAERQAAAEAFFTAAAGRLPVVVQVGHNALADARELAAHAQAIGATAISATPPSYFRPGSLELLVQCMAEIAAGAPKLPFYYYNIPSVTGVQFDMVEFLQRGGKAIPTLAGVKFTAPTIWEYQACVELDGGRFDCLYGTDEMLLESMTVGARGAVGSTYNFAAPLYRGVMRAFDAGDMAEARRLQGLAVGMVRVLLRYRALAGIKAMMKLIELDCGPTRLPLQTLSDTELAAMKQELQAIGFFQWGRTMMGAA